MEKAFREIEKQTDHRFVYTREMLQPTSPVSLQAKQLPLEQVLTQLFQNQPLEYSIDDKFIILKPKATVIQTQKNIIDVRGKVSGENGEPLRGTSVQLKNKNRIVETDETGAFVINDVEQGDILNFSYVGYADKELVVRSAFIDVQLSLAVSSLDETIVIGYGTTTKRMNTGSVSKISGKTISEQPVSNPLQALQGRAAGLFVTTENGLVGGNVKVQIRGQGSIAAGTNPLYVIDGVPFNAEPLSGGIINGANGQISPFNSINPDDIESVEILKDADATAIYGSRGGNGVILITTKRPKGEHSNFSFNYYTGFNKLPKSNNLLSLSEYLTLRREAFRNDNITPTLATAPDLLLWDTTKSIDWQNYLYGDNGFLHNLQLRYSAGSKLTQFTVGGHYRREESIFRGTQRFNRGGYHLSLRHNSANGKLLILLSNSYSADHNNQQRFAGVSAFTLPPHFPLFDAAGNLNFELGTNPLALQQQRSKAATKNLLSNISLSYQVIPDLFIKTNLGYTGMDLEQISLVPKSSVDATFSNPTNTSYFSNNNYYNLIAEPTIELNKSSENIRSLFLLGASWQNGVRKGDFLEARDFSNETMMENLAYAGSFGVKSNNFSQYKYASVFTKINLSIKQSYLLNLTFRRDGSSKFGPGKQFANFGAAGLGWIFSNNSFFQNLNSLLSFGKLRLSYGITGNDQILDYQYYSTYQTGSVYNGIQGIRPSRIANPNYGWEVNKKFETALELGLFKDRLSLTTIYYHNRSGNQLISYSLPSQSGFSSYQANSPAKVQNSGFEFEFSFLPVKNTISWNTSFNLSIPKNKLISFPGLETSSYSFFYEVGKDLSIIKAFRFLGVDPATGFPLIDDIDGSGNISYPSDLVVIGKISPDLFGGWYNGFNYKNFEASFFLQFVKQMAFGSAPVAGFMNNSTKASLQRWQKPGDKTNVPLAISGTSSAAFFPYTFYMSSDAAFQNVSYIRLKNTTVSYSLNLNKKGKHIAKQFKIYLEGQNLFTFANNGIDDPEVRSGSIPPLKTIVVGINLNF